MTKAERNGSFVLLFILTILILIRILVPYLIKEDKSYIAEIERKITILENQKDSLDLVKAAKKYKAGTIPFNNYYSYKEKSTIPENVIEYFQFDPNTVSYSQLISLGLSEKVASTFIKFRSKGARFCKADDLMRVYGIDSSTYQNLQSYITIETTNADLIELNNIPQKVKPLSIEINSADSSDWVTLSGIGPVYASRICNFRNYLGGFVHIEQLKEVYNFPEETYNKIILSLRIDTSLVNRININFADIEELKNHPYCDYATARKIVDYRSEHGSFLSINQLLNDSVLSNVAFKRLSPYYSLVNSQNIQ